MLDTEPIVFIIHQVTFSLTLLLQMGPGIFSHTYISNIPLAFRAVGIHRRHRPTYKSIIYIDSYIEIDKLLLCCLYWDIYAQKKRLKVSAPFDGPYIVSLKAHSKEEEDLFYKVKYCQYLYI